ncbi:MAG: hypothetical protein WC314_28160 [Vulcanimicrobiota bacterium]
MTELLQEGSSTTQQTRVKYVFDVLSRGCREVATIIAFFSAQVADPAATLLFSLE